MKYRKSTFLHFFLVFVFSFIFSTSLAPFTAYAQVNGKDTGKTEQTEQTGEVIQLQNPLKNIDSIPELVRELLGIALTIGTPIIALAIIYTGYLFISAQGNEKKLSAAKESLVYVFIGSMILLGSYVIAESLVNTINNIRG